MHFILVFSWIFGLCHAITTAMIDFEIIKASRSSRARLGVLQTAYGVVETPALVPVATQAAVKTLTSEEALAAKCQMLIANTFHLHLKPGERIVRSAGGLHEFMQWPRPLMTDSGGFQVFSLGFGRDFDVGKVLKFFPGNAAGDAIGEHAQPKTVRITPDGVHFRSPVDGRALFIGPRESVKIQEALGADIIFAFDECTAPLATEAYARAALERTHRWAAMCVKAKKPNTTLFGIVQGSHFKALREESARYIAGLDMDGYGIGGDLGATKGTMKKILDWTVPHLDQRKPRHLLGIGHLEDMEMIIKNGVDLFDCTVPTHYARRGVAFTSHGKLNMRRLVFLKDKHPLDRRCACMVCQTYRRNYITHLFRAGEITGMKLLTFHNLHFFNTRVEQIREKIQRGRL